MKKLLITLSAITIANIFQATADKIDKNAFYPIAFRYEEAMGRADPSFVAYLENKDGEIPTFQFFKNMDEQTFEKFSSDPKHTFTGLPTVNDIKNNLTDIFQDADKLKAHISSPHLNKSVLLLNPQIPMLLTINIDGQPNPKNPWRWESYKYKPSREYVLVSFVTSDHSDIKQILTQQNGPLPQVALLSTFSDVDIFYLRHKWPNALSNNPDLIKKGFDFLFDNNKTTTYTVKIGFLSDAFGPVKSNSTYVLVPELGIYFELSAATFIPSRAGLIWKKLTRVADLNIIALASLGEQANTIKNLLTNQLLQQQEPEQDGKTIKQLAQMLYTLTK